MNAREFAIAAHGDQKYSDKPYVKHLDDVYAVLVEFGVKEKDILTAAYLHDVLEDTAVDDKTLIKKFGYNVYNIVSHVTDKEGKNRRERHENTYPLLAEHTKSVILKLADRIANARASLNNESLLKMYRKEYKYFKEILYKEPFKYPKMWEELDRLLGE